MFYTHELDEYSQKLSLPEEFIPKNKLIPYNLSIILLGKEGVTGYPEVTISINNDILFQGNIVETQNLHFDIQPTEFKQKITINFTNKLDVDTLMAENQVIKDKFLKIECIALDQVSLDSWKYFKYTPNYPSGYLAIVSNPDPIIYTDYLSFNGTVEIEFAVPVLSFLAKNYYNEFSESKSNLTNINFKNLANYFLSIYNR
jgi:hypothetical protein